MRYLALACDYDGTIATHGLVPESTVAALARVQDSGRRLIMVTGRRLDDLFGVFPHHDLFDLIVAENGALLFDPRRNREELLSEPPSEQLLEELRALGVGPVEVGRAIVATWEPHDKAVLEAIHRTGLELQVTFNKGAIMVLPSGVNKNSGLRAALRRLGLSAHNTVGVGDAENDHAFLTLCEFSAAVANALEAVKRRVDLVTQGTHGEGVEQLIEDLLEDDLRQHDRKVRRHHLLLGIDEAGREVCLAPYGTRILISGPSGSGKSTIVTAILERLAQAEYQFCVVDPEGDYENFEQAITVGDEDQAPTAEQLFQLMERAENTVVSLLAVPVGDRPAFAAQLLQRMVDAHGHTGRPHWLLLDEAHHMLPSTHTARPVAGACNFASEVLVTVHPKSLSRSALAGIDVVIAVGPTASDTLAEFSSVIGRPCAPVRKEDHRDMDVLVWFCEESPGPIRVRVIPAEAERRRHRRKYAEGDLQEKSFVFRGPEGKLRLRAQNLTLFLQIAEGVDTQTWQHHLRQGDFSNWIRTAIKDDVLAAQFEEIEGAGLPPEESLARIRSAVEALYTGHV